jgi:hypothetical protein
MLNSVRIKNKNKNQIKNKNKNQIKNKNKNQIKKKFSANPCSPQSCATGTTGWI